MKKAVIILLGVSLMVTASVGCVVVPKLSPIAYRSSEVASGGDVPLKVGAADRKAVIARWGEPAYRTEHDLAFGYVFTPTTGTMIGLIGGPCGVFPGIQEMHGVDDVWLEFDDGGLLTRYERHLIKPTWWREDQTPNAEIAWTGFLKNIPDKPKK